MMKKWGKALLVIFALVYLSAHLLTLDISPIAWYDEVVLASETASFVEDGTILLEASPYTFSGEVRHYGPVFFLTQYPIISAFGMSMFSFRFMCFLFGVLALVAFFFLARQYGGNFTPEFFVFLVVILFALDPSIWNSMHNGRMETMAITWLVLSLLGLWLWFKNGGVGYVALATFFATLSIMTTPRVGFAFLGWPLLIFTQIILTKDFKKYFYVIVVAIGTLLFTYAPWFFWKFSSLQDFLQTYSEVNSGSGFVGISFRPKPYHYPLFLAFLVSVALSFRLSSQKRWFHFFVVVLPVVLYVLTVKEVGPYTTLMIPFVMLGVLMSFEVWPFQKGWKRHVIPTGVLGLLGIYTLAIGVKLFTVFATSEERNPKTIADFIKSKTTPGSTLVGGSKYFYAASSAELNFYYNEHDFSIEEFARMHADSMQFDYLMVAADRNEEIYNHYSKVATLEVVDTFRSDASRNSRIGAFISKMNAQYSYDGVLYRRESMTLEKEVY